jgi:hypothetical protein
VKRELISPEVMARLRARTARTFRQADHVMALWHQSGNRTGTRQRPDKPEEAPK